MLLAAPSFVWSAAVSDLSCLSDSQQMEGEREREEGERGEERRGLPLLCVCMCARARVCVSVSENRSEGDTMRQRQTARRLGKKKNGYCCRQGNRYRGGRDEMAAAYQIMPELYLD